ncbi:MAG: OmpH family outer membrane protein [Bacteroidales bacterium]|nr:OmpH family outer membrane protein [Bacteroidales bacterium]MBN2697312.1 OmpH family outer membrane protein [Bacteroidales bacterium]
MRKIISTLLVAFMLTGTGLAQKFAFVDTEYILQNIPSYNAAQEELNKMSEQWEAEIAGHYEEIEKMYKTYQSERVLLTEEMRTKREEEIISKEREVKDLQHQYFGPEGDLFKKREELVKPIQDALYKAVKEMSAEGGYAVIFDSASGASILYSNPRYDLSDEVLKKLGYKN